MDTAKLAEIIRSGKRLNIFLHDHPDPDSIAAGLILSRIAQSLGSRARILHGGGVERAENRAMVGLLRVNLVRMESIDFACGRAGRCAILDSQPGTGNNSFPSGQRCDIVIDHHPQRKDVRAGFVDIRPEEGACTTMLLGYFEAMGLKLDPVLATAAAYAISSETQDLEREATKSDREAFLRVFPAANLRILGRIRHPIRERAYYKTLARAMREVRVGKNTCVCHIGQVHAPEIVAEVADFLLPMGMVTWCLVTGYHEGSMVLSIRTKHAKGHADRTMRRMLGKLGRGGGHSMIAGGRAACRDLEEYGRLAPELGGKFLKMLERKVLEMPRPLLDEQETARMEQPKKADLV